MFSLTPKDIFVIEESGVF